MPAAAEPVPPPSPGAGASLRFTVHAWRPALRLLAMAAQVLNALNILQLAALAFLVVFEGHEAPGPKRLLLQVAVFSLLPLALEALLGWLTRGTLRVEHSQLVLELRGVRFEIPPESIQDVESWKLPLPGSGVTLRMKSGRRFQYGLQVDTPAVMLTAVVLTLPVAIPAAEHPGSWFGQARHDWRRRFWDKPAFKLGLVPLIPAGIMFRANQYITFGGPFGQYQMYGLGPYLESFALYWLAFLAGMVLFASFWRVLAEFLACAFTWLLPSRALSVRRAAEWLCRLVYYAGIPAVLARFFLG